MSIKETNEGEGVYGLGRVLALAGAEMQMMSPWPVSDKGTRELTVAYYHALLQGKGWNELLRRVQLEILI